MAFFVKARQRQNIELVYFLVERGEGNHRPGYLRRPDRVRGWDRGSPHQADGRALHRSGGRDQPGRPDPH